MFIPHGWIVRAPFLGTLSADSPTENRPTSAGDRKKWEAGAPLVVPPLAQQTLEQTCFTTIGEFPKVARLTQRKREDASSSHKSALGASDKLSSLSFRIHQHRANSWRGLSDWQPGRGRPQEGVGDESRFAGAEGAPGGGASAAHAAAGGCHHL